MMITSGSDGGRFVEGGSSPSSMMTDGTLLSRRSPAGTWIRGFGIMPKPPVPCARPTVEVLAEAEDVDVSSGSPSFMSFFSNLLVPSTMGPAGP